MSDYSLYQPNILEYLKHGSPSDAVPLDGAGWFTNAVARAFSQIGDGYRCIVDVSERRTKEAHALWLGDMTRMRVSGDKEPDHLKHAGTLAYWLRRRNIIERNVETELEPTWKPQHDFLAYGNEMAAFLVGFRIALFFHGPAEATIDRLAVLAEVAIDHELLMDIAIYLHQKNVSPHALYLIYRSLLYPLRLPPSRRPRLAVI